MAREWCGVGYCEELGARVEPAGEEATFVFEWPTGNPEGLMGLWALLGEDTPRVMVRSLELVGLLGTAIAVSKVDAMLNPGWAYRLITASGREVSTWDVGPLGFVHARSLCEH